MIDINYIVYIVCRLILDIKDYSIVFPNINDAGTVYSSTGKSSYLKFKSSLLFKQEDKMANPKNSVIIFFIINILKQDNYFDIQFF